MENEDKIQGETMVNVAEVCIKSHLEKPGSGAQYQVPEATYAGHGDYSL